MADEERTLTLRERRNLFEQLSASSSTNSSRPASLKPRPVPPARPSVDSTEVLTRASTVTRASRASSTASLQPSSPRLPVKDIIALYGASSRSPALSPNATGADDLASAYPPLSPTPSGSGSRPASPVKSRSASPLEPITLESFSQKMRSRAGSSASAVSVGSAASASVVAARGRSTSEVTKGQRTASPTSIRSSGSHRDLSKLDTSSVVMDKTLDPLAASPSSSLPSSSSTRTNGFSPSWTLQPPTPISPTSTSSFPSSSRISKPTPPPRLPPRNSISSPSRSASTSADPPPALPPRPKPRIANTLPATSSPPLARASSSMTSPPPIPSRPQKSTVSATSRPSVGATATSDSSSGANVRLRSVPPPPSSSLDTSRTSKAPPTAHVDIKPKSYLPSAKRDRPIDPRARRRYEKLFDTLLASQANSGDEKDAVRLDGRIVSCVWERSRLPREVLRKIWETCDVDHQASLSKDEFSKGMWSIDEELRRAQQRLVST